MFVNLVNKLKEVLKSEDNLFLSVTKDQAINAIKNILSKEITQLNKINADIQKDNENYKLNLSQFYFLTYSSKKNDVNIDILKMYLEMNDIIPDIDNRTLSNREVVEKVADNIEFEELNKHRLEKFLYEFEQIVQIFNLDDSNAIDLLDPHKKSVFNQYVDTFMKNNGKVEKYINY